MKYFIKENGKLVECTNIETYGYYQAGFQSKRDEGCLSTLHFIPGAGTCLVPVFNELGEKIIDVNKAGLYFNQSA